MKLDKLHASTMTFITAENPYGEAADPNSNRLSNQELEERLKSMNLAFKRIKGHYGRSENSFFVPNLTKKEALQLGKEFDQESIVFGKRTEDGIDLSLIYTDHRFGQERSIGKE